MFFNGDVIVLLFEFLPEGSELPLKLASKRFMDLGGENKTSQITYYYSSVPLYEWALRWKMRRSERQFEYCSRQRSLELFKNLMGNGRGYLICMGVSRGGDIRCLEYAHENGCEWNSDTCSLRAGSRLCLTKVSARLPDLK